MLLLLLLLKLLLAHELFIVCIERLVELKGPLCNFLLRPIILSFKVSFVVPSSILLGKAGRNEKFRVLWSNTVEFCDILALNEIMFDFRVDGAK